MVAVQVLIYMYASYHVNTDDDPLTLDEDEVIPIVVDPG